MTNDSTMETIRQALGESGYMLSDSTPEWDGIAYPHEGGFRVVVSPVAWEVQRHDVWRQSGGTYNGWSRVRRVRIPAGIDRHRAFVTVATISNTIGEARTPEE